MNPNEIEALLGAYALDAVSDDERTEIEAYLATEPRARDEVAQHREVASMMAFTGAPAPEGLWDRIVASLEELPPPAEVSLAPVTRLAEERARRRRWTRIVAAGAAAAAVAIGLLTAEVVHLNNKVDSAAVADPIELGAQQALKDPKARLAHLASADGQYDVLAAVRPDGTGFLVPHKLPPAAAGHTYQLWGIVDGKPISLGLLGRQPSVVSFRADGPVTTLAVTEEDRAGAVAPTQTPVMAGDLA
jgi:anti-sigma-K factor RskA